MNNQIWIPTGEKVNLQENTFCFNLYRAWIISSNPVVLIIISISAICAIIYFNIGNQPWMWGMVALLIVCAIVSFLVKIRIKGITKLFFSRWQARRHNTFVNAVMYLPNRYRNKIEPAAEYRKEDKKVTDLLYCHVGQTVVMLKLYDETPVKRVNAFTGIEYVQIEPIEFYVDMRFHSGLGFLLFEPRPHQMKGIEIVDEKVIKRILRDTDIRYINWNVERVSFDDDVVLYILTDSEKTNAYDFSGKEQSK
jgi:hypothetical protein